MQFVMLRKYSSNTDCIWWTQKFHFHYAGLFHHLKEYIGELMAIQDTSHSRTMKEWVLTLQKHFDLNKAPSCFTSGLQILCNIDHTFWTLEISVYGSNIQTFILSA